MTKDLLRAKLDSCPTSEFPGDSDYGTRFAAMESQMNEQIHPVVTLGASVADRNLLNDHGPGHIKTVIRRASDLLKTSDSDVLSCYETYLLLAAIHVHDVGNLYGREYHELMANKVMERLGALFGPDEIEKRAIFNIAKAHSGQNKDGKDIIADLSKEDFILNQRVHPRLLAALLRFADELADDRTRAARFLIEENQIPDSSLIYHKYAYALHSVLVEKDAINLKFYLAADDVTQPFKKDKKAVYLLDEIFNRTMKMHRERLYCMRFLRPFIDIDRIDVTIQVFGQGFGGQELANISYRLVEAGYPDETKPNIYVLCPELFEHEYGSPLNGPSLKFYIKDELKRKNK
jgi:hypothetical protein